MAMCETVADTFLFFHADAVLVNILQGINVRRNHVFFETITLPNFTTLYSVAVFSFPPHKFVRSPCLYYRL